MCIRYYSWQCSYCFTIQLLPHPNLLPSHPQDIPMQVVSLHCALTDETKHLINTERLNMMKKDAVLVNASRGPVVDEVALVKHLQENPNFRSALQVTCLSSVWTCTIHKQDVSAATEEHRGCRACKQPPACAHLTFCLFCHVIQQSV